jgi:hypothetical protein
MPDDHVHETRRSILPERSRKDSPAYLNFAAWWRVFSANTPETKYGNHCGTFDRVGALIVNRTRDDAEAAREAEEERRAMQSGA